MTVLQLGLHLVLEDEHLLAHLIFATPAGKQLVCKSAAAAAPELQRFGTVQIL